MSRPRSLPVTATLAAALLLVVAGCPAESTAPSTSDADASMQDATPLTRAEIPLDPELEEAATPVLRRLTATQYRNTLDQWFGEDLTLPASLEPDSQSDGLYAVGASVNGVSSLGVERYYAAAGNVATQLVEVAPLRTILLPCDPEADAAGCLKEVAETWTLRLWRRPAAVRSGLAGYPEQCDA